MKARAPDKGKKPVVLVVDDEKAIREQLDWALRDSYKVRQAADAEQALKAIRDHDVDLVLLDLRFPPHDTGIAAGRGILQAMIELRPSLPVIIMTGDTDRATAVEMVARGAFDLFRKPVEMDELRVILKRALRMRALVQEIGRLRSHAETRFGTGSLVGQSPAMRHVAALIRKVADTSATVLITGESGTGKELVARALHQLSSRRDAPFVALNCAAVPGSLIDDELFGHEKGAFTGAAARRIGKFEFASGGTLFLDEVGDVPESVQRKLLRVLQESEIERLGSNETIGVDVRLIAATHRALGTESREGRFRQDLLYRLKVVTIDVPPLRRRAGDVRLLAEHFLRKQAGPNAPKQFSASAMDALAAHDWPGNVRELENMVTALAVTCDEPVIDISDLPEELTPGRSPAAVISASGSAGSAGASLDLVQAERALIETALRRTGGNRTQAARLLGISRHVLLGRLRRHGLG